MRISDWSSDVCSSDLVKVTGYQWYWGYEYPDNGVSEIVSNMLSAEEAKKRGDPELLGVDNRLVLPVGRPIKILLTGADVINSFYITAFWLKEGAVTGGIKDRKTVVVVTCVFVNV